MQKAIRAARVLGILTLLALGAVGCGLQAQGEQYPTKTIELNGAFAAGGTSNVLGRVLGDFATKEWKVPTVFSDRPGGGGVVGTTYVLQAKPDGYTILVQGISALLNLAVTKEVPFKWDDGTWIGRIAVSPVVFVVKDDAKWKDLKSLAADLKSSPEKYKLGVNAVGGIGVFASAQLFQEEGINMSKVTRVVFDGGAPTVAAVAGGHVDFAAQNLSEVQSLIAAGKLKPLAVTTAERVKQLPSVPTTKELGYKGVNMMGWTTVMGPPKLPDSIVKKWEALLKKATSDAGFVAEMDKLGTIPGYMTAEEIKTFLGNEQKWATAVAEELGIRK